MRPLTINCAAPAPKICNSVADHAMPVYIRQRTPQRDLPWTLFLGTMVLYWGNRGFQLLAYGGPILASTMISRSQLELLIIPEPSPDSPVSAPSPQNLMGAYADPTRSIRSATLTADILHDYGVSLIFNGVQLPLAYSAYYCCSGVIYY
jgi:hypothetical protein